GAGSETDRAQMRRLHAFDAAERIVVLIAKGADRVLVDERRLLAKIRQRADVLRFYAGFIPGFADQLRTRIHIRHQPHDQAFLHALDIRARQGFDVLVVEFRVIHGEQPFMRFKWADRPAQWRPGATPGCIAPPGTIRRAAPYIPRMQPAWQTT